MGKDDSYHFAIPKYSCSTDRLKKIHENFIAENKQFDGLVDTTIYSEGTGHWFRLPGQSKGGQTYQDHKVPNTAHIIQRGELKDFIPEYIAPEAVNIDDKEYVGPIVEKKDKKITVKKNCDDSDEEVEDSHLNLKKYEELIDLLPLEYSEKYEEWVRVGFAISSISDLDRECKKSLYNRFSAKDAEKYEGIKKTNKKFESYTSREDGITIHYILNICKKDNKRKFNAWIKKHDYEIPEQKNKITKINEGPTYTEIKKIIENENYFFIKHPTSLARMVKDKFYLIGEKTKQELLLAPHIYKEYDPKKEKYVDKSFYPNWCRDPERKIYETIEFEPNPKLQNPLNYNMFKGFDLYDPDLEFDESQIATFMDMFRHVFTSDKEINHVLDWIAHIIQKPYKKTDVCLIFYSNTHGVGKNSIQLLLCEMMAKYTATLNTIDDMKSKFNSHLANKLILYGDEIKARGSDIHNQIKGIITRKRMMVEPKGITPYEINDCANYLFTTNNINCVKIDEGDRRFSIINCNEKKAPKSLTEIFYEDLEDKNKLKHFFKFLYNRAIPQKIEALENKIKKEIQSYTLHSCIRMIYKQYKDFQNESFTATDIHRRALNYSGDNHLQSNQSLQLTSKLLMKEFGEFFHKTSTKRLYTFPNNLLSYLREKRPEFYLEDEEDNTDDDT